MDTVSSQSLEVFIFFITRVHFCAYVYAEFMDEVNSMDPAAAQASLVTKVSGCGRKPCVCMQIMGANLCFIKFFFCFVFVGCGFMHRCFALDLPGHVQQKSAFEDVL